MTSGSVPVLSTEDHAEADQNFEGEYVDWLVPDEQIETARAALTSEAHRG